MMMVRCGGEGACGGHATASQAHSGPQPAQHTPHHVAHRPFPPAGQKTPAPRFRLLDPDGVARVGDFILPGDVYINVQRPTNTRDPVPPGPLPDSMFRPAPMSWKHTPAMAGEKCIVDKVMLTCECEVLGGGARSWEDRDGSWEVLGGGAGSREEGSGFRKMGLATASVTWRRVGGWRRDVGGVCCVFAERGGHRRLGEGMAMWHRTMPAKTLAHNLLAYRLCGHTATGGPLPTP